MLRSERSLGSPWPSDPDTVERELIVAHVARTLARPGDLRDRADAALDELSLLHASSSIGVWVLDREERRLSLIAYGAPEDVSAELKDGFHTLYADVSADDMGLPAPLAMKAGEPLWFRLDDDRLHADVRTWLRELDQVGVLFAIPLLNSLRTPVGCALATFPQSEPLSDAAVEPLLDGIGLISILVQNELLRGQQEKRRLYRQAAIGDVAAEVAHEVNNPLQGILGIAEILLSDRLPPAIAEDVLLIKSEAQRAAAILGNLLSFASPETTDPADIDVAQVVQEIASLKQRPFALADIHFTVEVDGDTPLVRVTPSHLRQVLHNVLSNARHAVEDDSDGGDVRVHIRPERGGVLVAVMDTGPGFAPEVVGQVFNPFFTTKSEGRGTGLGLHITERLVQANGGTVEASNWGVARVDGGEPGHGGAKVTFWLPAAPGKLEQVESEEPAEAAPAVLVVDDEPVIASVVARHLTRMGFGVTKVHSGTAALAHIDANGAYAAILMDLRMPGMDGRMLYRTIAQRHPDLVPRIAFMSGDTISAEVRTFLQGTDRPVLSKPFELAELEKWLASMGVAPP